MSKINFIKTIFISTLLTLSIFFPKTINARPSCYDSCPTGERCSLESGTDPRDPGNWRCVPRDSSTPTEVKNFFGELEPPPGVDQYNPGADDAPTGLITLFSNILKIIIYVGGFVALINLVVAGIQYIGSSGNPEITKKVSSKIWFSLLGVVIITSSIALTSLVGLIFFGNATIFLNPVIPTP